MRYLILILTLLLLALPTAALAQGPTATPTAPTTSATPTITSTTPTAPLPARAIAEYYDLDVATVQRLHQAGIGYGMMFRLLALVESGDMTVEELIAWKSEGNGGWGSLMKLARAQMERGENLGSAVRSYVRTQREERREQQSAPGSDEGQAGQGAPPENAGRPENAGPPDHAQGNQGQGQGNGRGNNGNGRGNGGNGGGNGNGNQGGGGGKNK